MNNRGDDGNILRVSSSNGQVATAQPPTSDLEEPMKIRTLLAALAFAAVSGTAIAAHCPMDMKAIDEALAKNPSLSAAQMADVKKYRAEGEAQHKAGKHQESVETLAKAKKILGI
jgi:cytochrome c556